MANLLIDSSFAKRSPTSNASYFGSLFKVGKPSVMACSNKISSLVIMMMPASSSFLFDARPTRNYHLSFLSALELSLVLLTSFPSLADEVNYAMKSAKAWPFIVVFTRNRRLY
ncbi:hypothetical protein L3X38_037578 [Prunus dulcis]|uniref:Uncharacterized protein n=1 Tax=Prunus dulcis TaxID=3755 RepID=A0AAD4YQK0_PRUDU|nr:hypothetical protein L3X38_037578 [Prunus dulcis]